jgi:uncharacterized protein (DUF433 family)
MSFVINIGSWGGIYVYRGATFRLCLGWVALTIWPFDIDYLISDLIEAVKTITEPAADEEKLEINPTVMLGKAVIRGTRIPVELILRKLSEGATEADLLEAYPRLTQADIQAALAYAADIVSSLGVGRGTGRF